MASPYVHWDAAYIFETKFEYIRPVWNMYLGGFDPEIYSSSDSSCPTLNLRGYRFTKNQFKFSNDNFQCLSWPGSL